MVCLLLETVMSKTQITYVCVRLVTQWLWHNNRTSGKLLNITSLLKLYHSVQSGGGVTLFGLLQVTAKFTCNLRWIILISSVWTSPCRWPRGPTRESAAFRLPKLRFQNSPRARKCVCCEWCVMSGRGLCIGQIRRPGEFYQLCVCVCLCVTKCYQVQTSTPAVIT